MIGFLDTNVVLVQATLTGVLLALSFQVPFRLGVFSFAGAGSFGIGAYTCAILVVHAEAPTAYAIGGAVAAAAGAGLVLGLVVVRLAGLYLALGTVAFDLTIGVVANNGGDLTGGATGLYGVLTDFGTTQMVVLTLAVVALVAFSERGRLSRRIETIREDPELAASMGIPVRRYRQAAFVISGALGGLAGAMATLVRTTIGPPDIGFSLIVLGLTMIVVGGARSWKGALIGAIVFTWLPETLAFFGDWHDLAYGLIVVAAAIYLPRGLHGLAGDGWRRLRRRRPSPFPEPSAPPVAEVTHV